MSLHELNERSSTNMAKVGLLVGGGGLIAYGFILLRTAIGLQESPWDAIAFVLIACAMPSIYWLDKMGVIRTPLASMSLPAATIWGGLTVSMVSLELSPDDMTMRVGGIVLIVIGGAFAFVKSYLTRT